MTRSKQRKEAEKLGALRAFPHMLEEQVAKKSRNEKVRAQLTRRILAAGPRAQAARPQYQPEPERNVITGVAR